MRWKVEDEVMKFTPRNTASFSTTRSLCRSSITMIMIMMSQTKSSCLSHLFEILKMVKPHLSYCDYLSCQPLIVLKSLHVNATPAWIRQVCKWGGSPDPVTAAWSPRANSSTRGCRLSVSINSPPWLLSLLSLPECGHVVARRMHVQKPVVPERGSVFAFKTMMAVDEAKDSASSLWELSFLVFSSSLSSCLSGFIGLCQN